MIGSKHLWHDVLLIWTFFTRLPAPAFQTRRTLAQALWALPIASLLLLLVQIAASLLLWLVLVWPSPHPEVGLTLMALCLPVVPLIATGALHWDGLADLFDGLGVGKERRRAVMRDPRIGSFGVLAVLTCLILQIGAATALVPRVPLSQGFGALALAALISRQMMAMTWALLASQEAMSSVARYGRPWAGVQAGWLAGFGLLAWIGGWVSMIQIAALVAAAGLWIWALRRWIGGATGDGLGATQVVSETALLLLFAAQAQ